MSYRLGTQEERELLRRAIDRERRRRLGLLSAEVWLVDELAHGPRDPAELMRTAKELGYPARQVRVAARRLCVVGLRDGGAWRLPERGGR